MGTINVTIAVVGRFGAHPAFGLKGSSPTTFMG